MQFPLIGSCVLFGLYIVIKLAKKELLDALLSSTLRCSARSPSSAASTRHWPPRAARRA